jgi:hypothetical protein
VSHCFGMKKLAHWLGGFMLIGWAVVKMLPFASRYDNLSKNI